MADFLITARITAPDELLPQARLLAAIEEPVVALQKALSDAVGAPIAVELQRARALTKEPVNGAPKVPRKRRTKAEIEAAKAAAGRTDNPADLLS